MSYSEFAITCHGGYCCGVKTIKGFHDHPANQAPEMFKKQEWNSDANGHATSSDKNFFTDAAPSETYEERFDRYLSYLRRRRPQGLVEIYLIEDQKATWEGVIKKRGFKKDVTFKNSNSYGREITRYFLVMGPATKPVAKEKPLREPSTA